jgi:hypothetical protein
MEEAALLGEMLASVGSSCLGHNQQFFCDLSSDYVAQSVLHEDQYHQTLPGGIPIFLTGL